jgi:hypothetical protein
VVTEGSKYLDTFLTYITHSYQGTVFICMLFKCTFSKFYSNLCVNSLQSSRSLILFCVCMSAIFIFFCVAQWWPLLWPKHVAADFFTVYVLLTDYLLVLWVVNTKE